MTKICELCGKEYETIWNSQKLCSYECRIQRDRNRHKTYYKKNRSSQPAIYIACEICGEKFERTKKNKKYCSQECVIKSRALNNLKFRPPRPEQIKNCEICGKEFKTYSDRHIYCSNNCNYIAQQHRRNSEYKSNKEKRTTPKVLKIVYKELNIFRYKDKILAQYKKALDDNIITEADYWSKYESIIKFQMLQKIKIME